MNEPRAALAGFRALCHAQVGAHAQGLNIRLQKHFAVHIRVVGGNGFRGFRQGLGSDNIRGRVDQILAQIDAFDRLCARKWKKQQ